MPDRPGRNIWVGSYTADTGGLSEGIGRIEREADGTLTWHGIVAATDSPSFLTLTLSGDTMYAVGEGAASVSAFRISGNELQFLGSQDAAGESPCSVAVLGDDALLAVACYRNGAVGVHRIQPGGSITRHIQTLFDSGSGPNEAQDGPHAHDVLRVDAATVLSTDLGTDRVHVHVLDEGGLTRTSSVQLPPGSGPRDLRRHPSGLVWVLTELSGEVFVLHRDGDGFAITSSIGLPGFEQGDHAAALVLGGDGRFAYAGIRGSNRISVLAVEAGGALLLPVTSVDCGGGWPRHLAVDGDLLYVANQLSSSVASFDLGADGVPAFRASIDVPSPSYLLVD